MIRWIGLVLMTTKTIIDKQINRLKREHLSLGTKLVISLIEANQYHSTCGKKSYFGLIFHLRQKQSCGWGGVHNASSSNNNNKRPFCLFYSGNGHRDPDRYRVDDRM